LFTALLRAVNIPARQVFVEIDSQILFGVVNPGTRMVDHSFVEVYLNNQWVATDAYIVDPDLFRFAKNQLTKENRLLGYGAHQTGSNEWDGIHPSFSQYNMLDSRPIGSKIWGPVVDVREFYQNNLNTHSKLNLLIRSAFALITASTNKRLEGYRDSL
jgi:transglutaminase-like putative cysteine protease